MTKKNNYFLSICLLLILLLNISESKDRYKYLVSKEYTKFDSIIVENDSMIFSGYLVFKIFKTPDTNIYYINNNFYACDIFWIDSLKYIKNELKINYYNYFTLSYTQYIDKNDYLKNSKVSYKKFKDFYYRYRENVENNKSKFFLWVPLTTKILEDGTKFWSFSDNDTAGYFVFENTFETAILNANFSYIKKNNKDTINIVGGKIFLPTSEQIKLSKVDEKEMINNGFKEATWYPSDLFNK